MKQVLVVAIAILMALYFTGPVFAADYEKPAQAKPAEPTKPTEPAKPEAPATVEKPKKAVKTRSQTGEVVSADVAGRILVLKVKEKELTFSVAEKAAAKLADLKPGDRVTVRYVKQEGGLLAKAIAPAKKAAKKAKAKPAAPAPPAETPLEKK